MSLPDHGITLTAPWWAAVIWGGKRLENRGRACATIARRVHRVALSTSKFHDGQRLTARADKAMRDIRATMQTIKRDIKPTWSCGTLDMQTFVDHAGCIVGMATIVEVLSPAEAVGNGWHHPGSYGLILDDVQAITPIPCSGGQAIWRLVYCRCGRPIAQGARCPVCRDVGLMDGRRPASPPKPQQMEMF